MTTTTSRSDLVQRARKAHATAQARTRRQDAQRHTDTVDQIHRALGKLGITPSAGEPFTNQASGQICVPLITGALDVETTEDNFTYPVQTHAVAAEWDNDDRSVYLVADLDYDDDGFACTGRYLYPAGYLHTLADLGRAIEQGGRKPSTPVTAKSEALRVLHSLNGDHLDCHDTALLTAAEAVCAALADVADAIRAGHGL